jgi:hypothetical protein
MRLGATERRFLREPPLDPQEALMDQQINAR